MAEFCMPSLGADMDSGALVEWHVKPGDPVKRGDVIAEVETNKGVIEIEVFEDGVIEQMFVQPSQQQIPVGTVIAKIRPEGVPEAVGAPTSATRMAVVQTAPVPTPVVENTRPVVVAPSEGAPQRVRVSPLARKIAADLGVDLSAVIGTGLHGAIEKADVERAAAEKQAAPPQEPVAAPPVAPSLVVPPPATPPPAPVMAEAPPVPKPGAVDFQTGMRKAIAAAMARSNRDIPHYYLQMSIDMSRPLRWLEAENQKRSIKQRLLPVVLLLKATARALSEVPALNGFWIDDQHMPQEAINIGIAIALRQGGLITPAIHNVDLKSLDDLMEALNDLIMRTRTGHLRGSEMTDATITMTSLGDMGVETVYGVIYPPQVALVGLGKVVERPWAENGMLGVRPVLTATLAGDHRATDGRTGAQFLDILNRNLQEVEKL